MKILKSVLVSLNFILIISCSSGDEKFREWINVNEGQILSDEGLNYLIDQFGLPVDTLIKGDDKIFQYSGVNSFFSPQFSKEEAKSYISDYNARYDKLYEWLKESGRRQGLSPEFQTGSFNGSYESFKIKKGDLWDEFRTIYYNRVEEGVKYSFNELVQDYNLKNPELSTAQSKDSIIKLYYIDDFDKTQFISIAYQFKVEENIWYSKYYDLYDDEKDYLIDLFQEVRIDNDGVIISDYNDGSYCLSEVGKKKLKNHITGVWNYRMGSSDRLSTFDFSENGTYTYNSRMFSISKRGEWWVTCGGEIGMTNQDRNLQVLKNGIQIGETIYRKN